MPRTRYKQLYLEAQGNVASLTARVNQAENALEVLSEYGAPIMERLVAAEPTEVRCITGNLNGGSYRKDTGFACVPSETISVCYTLPRHEWEALYQYVRRSNLGGGDGAGSGFRQLEVKGYPVVEQ
jgi:hypothetical protein